MEQCVLTTFDCELTSLHPDQQHYAGTHVLCSSSMTMVLCSFHADKDTDNLSDDLLLVNKTQPGQYLNPTLQACWVVPKSQSTLLQSGDVTLSFADAAQSGTSRGARGWPCTPHWSTTANTLP